MTAGGTRRPGELPPLPKVASASPVDPLVGQVIGDRYKILDRLGSGGMATVYKAEHQSLKKAVAVKVLLPELAVDQDMVARFEREALAAARLEHPNCVSITDFGRIPGGRLYLAMEYLEGTPLSDLAGYGKRLSWERSVEIARQVLRGLARAHECGIVHRDLKPSNVMVTPLPGGRDLAKIIDFGIAKLFDGSHFGPHVETRAGIVFGTADFMAPERLLGKGDTDPRSDLYSVAVLLYEMICGERPFHDDDPYIIVKRSLAEQARLPSTIVGESAIPAPLQGAIMRGLEKDPDKRYSSARDFLAALDPIGKRAANTTGYVARGSAGDSITRALVSGPLVAGSSPAATPASGWLPIDPVARRRTTRWLVAAAAVVLLVPLLILLVVVASNDDRDDRAGAAPASPEPPAESHEIDRLVTQAGQGDSVEDRQRAFDRLVALGYRDRVPWVDMLSRDLDQLASCERRRDVVAQLRSLNDPAAVPALRKAAARADNDCLQKSANGAVAALSGTPAPAPSPAAPAPPENARRRHTPKTSAGGAGGGHF